MNGNLISFDYAIKYLLKDKANYDIVEGFISAIIGLQGYKPIKITGLLDTESNKEEQAQKKSIADLVVEDENNNSYMVEINRSYAEHFMHKSCFNSARLIADSVSTTNNFMRIKKVFHITLIYKPTADLPHAMYHGETIFHPIDTAHPQRIEERNLQEERFFSRRNIFPEYFIVAVPRFNEIITSEIDEWLYVMKKGEVKKEFKSPTMQKVAERLSLLSMNENQRNDYIKYMNDIVTLEDQINTAKAEREVEIAKALIQQGLSLDNICQATGLPQEQVETLMEKKEINHA